MKRSAILISVVVFAMSALPLLVSAETDADADAEAIRATVLNYLEGWHTSDPVRMDAALHPNLFKCTLRTMQGMDEQYLSVMTKDELCVLTGHNQDWVKDQGFKEMEIVFQNEAFAVVHANSTAFYDICGLVKVNGEWKILQVMWAPNPQ